MITEICNVNSKSFNNYSSDTKFKKVNIIFGINGSGKTSLATWLAEQNLNVSRIFNSEYVQRNILTQDSLRGVKLTVGQVAIDIEKSVMNINDANMNLSNQKILFKKNLDTKNNSLLTILNTYLKQAREHFDLTKNNNIKQKPNAALNPIKAFNLWIKDIQPSLSVPNSLKELEQQKELYQTNIDNLSFLLPISKDRFNKFAEIMEKKVLVPSTSISNEISQWVSDGLKVHNMENKNEVCQFCGNIFDGPKIAKIIDEKTNNKHAKCIRTLKEINDHLNQVKSNILSIEKKFNDIDAELAIKFITNTTKAIEKKSKNTSIPVHMDNANFNDLLNFKSIVEKKSTDYQEKIKAIDKQLSQIEIVARSWVGTQLNKNTKIPYIIKDIHRNEELIKKYTSIIDENEKWISLQESSTSDLKAFRDLANNQFELLGLNFRLEIMSDNQHYLIKNIISDSKLSTKDLSEGECRLLGFLHFYFDLFDKPNESLTQGVELIILDDPITSLDINNRYYLTQLINKLIKEMSSFPSQLFIFTHSSLDFHNFGFNANKQTTEWFKISKDIKGNSGIDIVDADERKNYSDYYQANFKDVFKFALISKTKLPTSNYISYGNKARLLFESHARTHYKLEYVTNKEHSKLKEFYKIPDVADDKFTDMLNVINSLSHGLTFADENKISALELQRNIRFMFKILYNKDKFHVKQMAGNLINKENCHNIQQWLNTFESES